MTATHAGETSGQAVVIVHFDENGNQSYRVIGDAVRLFIVDERAPNDRVYELLSRDGPEAIGLLIPPGSSVGNNADDRHEAVKARIEALQDNRPHLKVVEP